MNEQKELVAKSRPGAAETDETIKKPRKNQELRQAGWGQAGRTEGGLLNTLPMQFQFRNADEAVGLTGR